MATYLIDYENVNQSSLIGLESKSKKDDIIIFYNANRDKATLEMLSNLLRTKANIKLINVETGLKNSLDMQLASYLGALIGIHDDDQFYIVSRDKCFDFVVKFWEKRSINISRVLNLENETGEQHNQMPKKEAKPVVSSDKITNSNKNKAKPVVVSKAVSKMKTVTASVPVDTTTASKTGALSSEYLYEQLEILLPNNKNDHQKIVSIILEKKTRSQINNTFCKMFGGEVTKQLNKAIKPIIKTLPGN